MNPPTTYPAAQFDQPVAACPLCETPTPQGVTSLQELLGEAGEIKDVYLPTDRVTGRPRGFAFVEFSSPEEAQQAIEKFNDHELGGRKLRINEAEDRPRRGPGAR